MEYDYEWILASYRDKYAALAEQAAPRSIERQTYEQIVRLIVQNKTEPLKKRAFQLTLTFLSFATTSSKSEVRAIYRQCGLDLNRDLGLEPWSF